MVRTVPREKGGDVWDIFYSTAAAALEVFGCRRTAQEVTRSVYFQRRERGGTRRPQRTICYQPTG